MLQGKGPGFVVLALLKHPSHPWSPPDMALQRHMGKAMCLASHFRKDIRTEGLGGTTALEINSFVKVLYYGCMSLPLMGCCRCSPLISISAKIFQND